MFKSMKIAGSVILLLWAVYLLNFIIIFIDFRNFGIIPRQIYGLPGIIISPFLHVDINHLMSNTLPLAVLLTLVLAFYEKSAVKVIWIIIILGGLLVWIFARPANHIGASGVIYGLAAFLFAAGIFKRDLRSIIIASAIFFLYSGLVFGLIPVDSRTSWEGHLFGAAAGVISAYAFRKVDEKPA